MSLQIANVVNFRQSLINQRRNDERPQDEEKRGGILSHPHISWLVRGAYIEVVNTKNGRTLGSWTFGSVLRDDSSYKIKFVEEIVRPNGRLPFLAVALNCQFNGGLICIFDFLSSKIMRAIVIEEHITAFHVVQKGADAFSLPGPLNTFDGVICVGTQGGGTFLVDLCKHLFDIVNKSEVLLRDELQPCGLYILTLEEFSNVDSCKRKSYQRGDHIAIHLNAIPNKSTHHFVLKGPKGDDKLHVNQQEVAVSALFYCPQLASLLVGYNFGAFQMWGLRNLQLIYTSPICEEPIPISQFAVQEPVDDPRAFCYIWAVYASNEIFENQIPNAVMYSFSYESKEFCENQGIIYENFQYSAVRFQMEMGFNEQIAPNSAVKGIKCERLSTLTKGPINSEKEIGKNEDSNDNVLSLCYAVWTIFGENENYTLLAVFDLNEWYREQMPNKPDYNNCSNYLLHINIGEKLKSDSEAQNIFDMIINTKSIHQFIGVQRQEEHYCPTSLSFDISCLLDNKLVSVRSQGIQKSLLYLIENAGPLCLIRPAEIYQYIISTGLTPLFLEIPLNSPVSLNWQREVILNVALEQHLTGWLCKCASDWSNGSFSSAGCSLDFFLTWAFQRATTLKNNCDKFCVPLFDFSGLSLDANTSKVLASCMQQISNICLIYSYVIKNLKGDLANIEVIECQYKNLGMVSHYYEILQWGINVGLLPETSVLGALETTTRNVPYPVDQLTEYYLKKRTDLQALNNDRFSTKKSVLFIDNLIENDWGGTKLQKQWQNDGGSGQYPPPSLQALLRTYLIDDVDLQKKHSVVAYLFLDLAMSLDSDIFSDVNTNLIKFPTVFKVSPALVKIVQAFWQLDHGDFNLAMEQFLDPVVSSDDLEYWHHKTAIKSLLLQEQNNLALLYMQVKQPPVMDEEDILMSISLLISNNMLDEAFYFQKQYESSGNPAKLITHLFNECNNCDVLKNVIFRTLTPKEESAFLKYLSDVKHPKADDLKILYYLQKSRYIEAFEAYDNCGPNPENKGLFAQTHAKARDHLISYYKKLLPSVTQNFVNGCRMEKNKMWKEVARPKPMSVFVHNSDEKIKYKSTFVYAALAKAKETFNDIDFSSTPANLTTQDVPFLRTPTALPPNKSFTVKTITPRTIEELGPSPAKIRKLSSDHHLNISLNNSNIFEMSKLSTPVVARSKKFVNQSRDFSMATTPQSILKVSGLKNDNESIFEQTKTPQPSNVSSKLFDKSPSPRKTVLQTPSRTPTVRFDVPRISENTEPSESSISMDKSNESHPRKSDSSDVLNISSRRSLTPSKSSTGADMFFSPNNTLNDIEEMEKDNSGVKPVVEMIVATCKKDLEVPLVVLGEYLTPKKLVDYDFTSGESSSSKQLTPQCRKSYKRELNDATTPIRSSPRLSKSFQQEPSASTSEEKVLSEPIESPRTKKLQARKSLTRKVLENNAIQRLLTPVKPEQVKTTSVVETTFVEQEKIVLVVEKPKSEELSFVQRKTEISDVFSKNLTSPEKEQTRSHSEVVSTSIRTEITLEQSSSSSSDTLEPLQDVPTSENQLAGQQNPQELIPDDLPLPTEELALPDSDFSMVYEDLPVEPQEKLEDRESDPKMNVFELSDDLDPMNEAFNVDEEPILQDELTVFAEDPNELQNIMEESVSPRHSLSHDTDNNPFDDNIFNISVGQESKNSSTRSSDEDSSNSSIKSDKKVIEINTSSSSEEDKSSCYSKSTLRRSNSPDSRGLVIAFEENKNETAYDDSTSENNSSDESSSSSNSRKSSNSKKSSNSNKSSKSNKSSNSNKSSISKSSASEASAKSNDKLEERQLSADQEEEFCLRMSPLQEETEHDEPIVSSSSPEHHKINEIIEEPLNEELEENNSNLEEIIAVENTPQQDDISMVQEAQFGENHKLEEVQLEEVQLEETQLKDVKLEESTKTDHIIQNPTLLETKSEELPKIEEALVRRTTRRTSLSQDQKSNVSKSSTPSNKSINSPARRITRRSSALTQELEENVESPAILKVKIPIKGYGKKKLVEPAVESPVEPHINVSEEADLEESAVFDSPAELKVKTPFIKYGKKRTRSVDVRPTFDQTEPLNELEEKSKNVDVSTVLKVKTPKMTYGRTRTRSVDVRPTFDLESMDTKADSSTNESKAKTNGKKRAEAVRPISELEETVSNNDSPATLKVKTPAVTYTKKRTRSVDVRPTFDLEEPSSKVETGETEPKVKTYAGKRTRSVVIRPTFEENATLDVKKIKMPSSKKTSGSASINLEEVTSGEKSVGRPRKTKAGVKEYAMSRRLTRRQASILEETLKKVEENDEAQSDEDLELIDPIVLLDKPTFEGKPDPDEQKIYDTSPSNSIFSSSTSVSVRPKRRGRSASNVSDSPSRSEISTPLGTPVKPKILESPVREKGIKGRLRTRSIDEPSDVSPKKTRKKSQKSESNASNSPMSTRSTRSRAISESSESASVKSSRGRNWRLASTKKSNLPEIQEETNDSGETTSTVTKKRSTRKTKK